MIRPITIHDLKSLESSAQFALPNVNDPLYFYQIAVEDEKGLVGIALVKLTTEVSLIFDKEASDFRKTKALLEVWEPIEKCHENNRLDDTHVFLQHGDEVKREAFSRTLRRLGFVNATGIPMYYRVGSNQWLRDHKTKQWRKEGRLRPPQQRRPVVPYREGERSANQD